MSVQERIKALFDKDYEFFGACGADTVERSDNYGEKLRAELGILQSQDTVVGGQLELLPYLTTLKRLELANQQMEQTILKLDEQIKSLSDREIRETTREESLSRVNHHLNRRLDKLQSLDTDDESSPANIVKKIRDKTEAENETSQALLRSLKYVLNGCVSSSIEAMGSDTGLAPKELASRLRKTVQVLINSLLEAESGLSDGYIEFDGNVNDPILQFLIRGEHVTTKPENLKMIKLRSYGL